MQTLKTKLEYNNETENENNHNNNDKRKKNRKKYGARIIIEKKRRKKGKGEGLNVRQKEMGKEMAEGKMEEAKAKGAC